MSFTEFEENVIHWTFPLFYAEASHASASHRSSHASGLVVPQARHPRTADECCSGYLPPNYPALNFNRVQYVTASSVNFASRNLPQCVVSKRFFKAFFLGVGLLKSWLIWLVCLHTAPLSFCSREKRPRPCHLAHCSEKLGICPEAKLLVSFGHLDGLLRKTT